MSFVTHLFEQSPYVCFSPTCVEEVFQKVFLESIRTGDKETTGIAEEESEGKVSSIPSVVMEPASNNEGVGEEHDVIMNESKDAAAEMGTQGTDSETCQVVREREPTEEIQTAPSQDQPASAGGTASDMPLGFLFKVCLFAVLLDILSHLASVDVSEN
ncbi:amphiphysin-like [Lagopus leucura]|uniref:amphiphysin-like n=1 Tax=Lagopus leucura TaxID=30410 RepID=UPI001C683CEA|nr:amphiphysin-like [Lagopus leucura]XP_042750579.1 amphiphysin-like [Lagopus leucura]XP_042750580.1 amphiphysin-like [Lagopus leucura]XP_042750581.1 amphiphysin-like [Lagopus leucura]XP_042750583.1 amphiphysin-like [Lagopus leucura]XP_042750584.1 amphiphysin-like [Lagopus leucura]